MFDAENMKPRVGCPIRLPKSGRRCFSQLDKAAFELLSCILVASCSLFILFLSDEILIHLAYFYFFAGTWLVSVVFERQLRRRILPAGFQFKDRAATLPKKLLIQVALGAFYILVLNLMLIGIVVALTFLLDMTASKTRPMASSRIFVAVGTVAGCVYANFIILRLYKKIRRYWPLDKEMISTAWKERKKHFSRYTVCKKIIWFARYGIAFLVAGFHFTFLRFFYIPMLMGVAPWSVPLDGGQKIVLYGVPKDSVSYREAKYMLNALPRAAFQPSSPGALHFYNHAPEIWKTNGLGGGIYYTRPWILSRLNRVILMRDRVEYSQSLCWHELWHHVYYSSWFLPQRQLWDRLYVEYRKNPRGFKVSEYSLKNKQEGFAEWGTWFIYRGGYSDYFAGSDSIQQRMWLIIAGVCVETIEEQPHLKINYPILRSYQHIGINLNQQGLLAWSELIRAIHEARDKQFQEAFTPPTFPLSRDELLLWESEDSVMSEVGKKLRWLGRVGDRRMILNRQVFDLTEQELTDLLGEIILQEKEDHDTAVDLLIALGNDEAMEALFEYSMMSCRSRFYGRTHSRIEDSLNSLSSERANRVLTNLLRKLIARRRSPREEVSEKYGFRGRLPFVREDNIIIETILRRNAQSIEDKTIIEKILQQYTCEENGAGGLSLLGHWNRNLSEYLRKIEGQQRVGSPVSTSPCETGEAPD